MFFKKLIFFICILSIVSCSKDEILEFNQWKLSNESFSELLELSDTTGLTSYDAFGIRMDRIQQIFAEIQDPRGTFPTMYEQITFAAINSIEEDIYENGQFVGDFGLLFGKLYLINLNHHLLNKPLPIQWETYYNECVTSNQYTKLLFMGMNAHISIDLVDALIGLKVSENEESDWVLISSALLNGVPIFQTEFESTYTPNIDNLISLYGFGDLLDEIYGENTSIYTLLNELRYVGYLDALKHQNGFEKNIDNKVLKRFQDQNNIIELLDNLHLLP